jgi:hypothetical protein
MFGLFLEEILALRFFYHPFRSLLICLINIFFKRIYLNLVSLIFFIIPCFLSHFLLQFMTPFLFSLSFVNFWVKCYNLMRIYGHRFRFSSVLNGFNIWYRFFLWLYRSQTLKVSFNVVYEFAFIFGVITFFVSLLGFCLENTVFCRLFPVFFRVSWRENKEMFVRFLLFVLDFLLIIFCLLLRFRLNFYNTRLKI